MFSFLTNHYYLKLDLDFILNKTWLLSREQRLDVHVTEAEVELGVVVGVLIFRVLFGAIANA